MLIEEIKIELDSAGECGCDYAPDGWECEYHADITQNGPLGVAA